VVITENGWVQDFDFTVSGKKQIKGNIYLAKITRVEPSLQAAFVEYGGNKQAFLPFSEIHPDYYQIPVADKQKLLEEEEKYLEEQENIPHTRSQNAREGRMRIRRGRRDRKPDAAILQEGETEQSDGLERIPTEVSGTEESANVDNIEASNIVESSEIISVNNNEEPSEEILENTGATSVDEPEAASTSEQAEGESEAAEVSESQEYEQVGGNIEEELARPNRKFSPRKRYSIQEVIKKGQVILIQVIKEERGNKGAAASTYISLPGRYCVLMPNTLRSAGISRRISDPEDRRRLKSVTDSLELTKGMSVIIRTAGIDRSKPEIKRDFEYLTKLWETIRENTLSSFAPALVYEEGDLIKRSLRDYYTSEIDEVIIEGEEAFKTSKELMKMLMPSHAAKVKQHVSDTHIYQHHDVEEQLLSIHDPIVKLRSGGYIVINSTEALVAIDVNSGRSTGERNIEETATRTNLEAAREVARQLRLRDIAGLIVIDFIDMAEMKNRRVVEKALKESLRSDRAKIQIGRISIFGLLEMTRQRLRPSIIESVMTVCPSCSGSGLIKNTESLSLDVIRRIESFGAFEGVKEVVVKTSKACALFLLNSKRDILHQVEKNLNFSIRIEISEETLAGGYSAECSMHPGFKDVESQRRRIKRPFPPSRTANRSIADERPDVENPEHSASPDMENAESIEGATDEEGGIGKRNRNNRGRNKGRVRMRGGRGKFNGEYAANDDENTLNSDTSVAATTVEGEAPDAISTSNDESPTREPRRNNNRRYGNRPERGERAANNKEQATSEAGIPVATPAENSEPVTPKPRASKIEKISEFKNREKPVVREEEPQEQPAPPSPDAEKSKRSGWWGRLIK